MAEPPRPDPPAPPPPPALPPDAPEWYGRPDAPWSATTYQRWVNEIDKVPWLSDSSGDRKSLPCPRCTHPMTLSLHPGIVEDAEPGTPARCNCETGEDVHKGRPKERVRGCGQNARVARP